MIIKSVKRAALLALIMILPITFCFTAQAFSGNIDDYYDEQMAIIGADGLTDGLTDETKEILYDVGADEIKPGEILSMSADDIFRKITDTVKGKATQPVRTCCAVIGIILIYSMLDSMKKSTLGGTLDKTFGTVSVLCTAAVLIVPVTGIISDCTRTVESCSIFLDAYIPAFAALMVFSSAGAASAVYSSILFGASHAVSAFARDVIIPLNVICFAVSLMCALSEALDFGAISKCLSKTVTWSLGLIMTIYVGLMTIQGAVGASADSVALKSAKFFASSALPVVGGAVSEAMATVFSGLNLVKTTVGSAGIVIIAAIFLPYLIELLCWKALLGLASSVGALMGHRKIASVLKSASSAVSVILAVIACYALLIIICTALMLKASADI
ncbi:MAG: stage III sporulation protein AE [Clostridia bacterium]|nr:stage III sporulation protein AE [Clostridia bacterium]